MYMLQDFIINHEYILANTFYKKRPESQITYKIKKTIGNQPPYTKGRYDVSDYIMIGDKWKNAISLYLQ